MDKLKRTSDTVNKGCRGDILPYPPQELALHMNDLNLTLHRAFPGGASGKNPQTSAGDVRDTGSIHGSERSPGGGNGNPLQYSCLENPMDTGAWWATVHGVTKRIGHN